MSPPRRSSPTTLTRTRTTSCWSRRSRSTACAGCTERVVQAGVGAPPRSGFDETRAWQLHPQVALRDESFGALAYHYGNRRLVFLKSRMLVELVSTLDRFDSATGA